MPRQNTQLFSECSHETNKEIRLKADDVSAKLKAGAVSYEVMSDLLRETNDAQFGIVSTLQPNNIWLRDATTATPLEQRMSREAPVLEANNCLLRCLSRLRPIDYAIDKKMGAEGTVLRQQIKDRFSTLTEEILNIAQGKGNDEEKNELIKKKEEEFNTFLVEKLHDADLTKGCKSGKDAEKLLFHYRNLSSILSPARTMVTLTYDKEANVLQRETQYPVTKKTKEQNIELTKLATITPYPSESQKNSHTSQKLASQEADHLFADLFIKEDRVLGAQARKSHLVGTKNAFIVKNELMPRGDAGLPQSIEEIDGLHAAPADTLWLARMGSPAYVGKGEETDAIQTHTQENLQQVRETSAQLMGKDAAKFHVHVTTLNTYTFLEQQSVIVNSIYKATREAGKGDNVSYVPTNPDGTFRALDIAPDLDFAGEAQPRGSAPLQKATRIESVSKIVLAASRANDTISIVNCASGQDRTGTAIEKATQDWMKKQYAEKGLSTTNIDHMRAEGGNAAEITTHHIHGSPGMKTDSLANNFFGSSSTFSKEASDEMYLSSAKTNKQNKVGNVAFLLKTNDLARAEYQKLLATFEAAIDADPSKASNPKEVILYEKGRILLNQVKDIAGEDPTRLKAGDLERLNQALRVAHKGLSESDNVAKTKENARELTAIAQNASGKSSSEWKALGIGLLTFACAVLVTVGLILAIPTAGASLLATAAGAVGLSTLAGAGIVAASVTAAAVGGSVALYRGTEKGFAKTISDYKAILHDLKNEDRTKIANDEPLGEEDNDSGMSLKS